MKEITVHRVLIPGPTVSVDHKEWASATLLLPHDHFGESETVMTVKFGLLALLESKPDKGNELGAFLESGRSFVVAEGGTVTWYAFKISDTEYGIFDSFETGEVRQVHLSGEIPTALGHVAPDLLAKDPDIRTVDIIAVK